MNHLMNKVLHLQFHWIIQYVFRMLFTIPGKSWQICDKSLMKRVQTEETILIQNRGQLKTSTESHQSVTKKAATLLLNNEGDALCFYIYDIWHEHITSPLSPLLETWKQRLKCVYFCPVFKEYTSMIVEYFSDLLST